MTGITRVTGMTGIIKMTGMNKITRMTWVTTMTVGPVVRTPVSTNLRLNFNQGFFFLLSKALFLFFLQYPIIKLYAKRIKLNLLFKFSYLSSNFALTLCYLNPALNNPALTTRMTLSLGMTEGNGMTKMTGILGITNMTGCLN